MSSNADIAAIFEQMAALLELTGADKFRVNAHARAARAIEACAEPLVDLADDLKALEAIEGIGAKSAKKIAEYAETGEIKEHRELLAKVPSGLLDVLAVPGLGPKTVKLLWEEKGVEGIDDLKRIIEDGSIADVPRMGAKTIANIADAISFAERSAGRLQLGLAVPIAEMICERLRAVKGAGSVEYAGSARRGRETVGDLDILASGKDEAALHDAFSSMPEVEKVLASGESKSSVRMQVGKHLIQADLRVVGAAHHGAALMYFTGSKEFNVRLRERALKKGMTLNEYGLYPEDQEKTPPQHRGVKPIASKTEEAIFEALGVAFVPPELREEGTGWERWKQTPELIEVKDIRAELHAHTTASDGAMSIEELVEAAKERGFHTIAVTDHSRSSAIAGGLSVERLMEHIEAVREVDAKTKGITVLAGSEVDILADGTLDYEDKVLKKLDVVVASPHASLRQEPVVATERLLKAIANPFVHILGHPTGRLIGEREALSPDIGRLVAAAVEHRVALEINSHWRRLDLRDVHVRAAMSGGALIAIDCDVHRAEQFGNIRYGIATARRGGVAPERCINTWTAKKLHALLKAKR
ncbi:MAG: DNA polymerase/3'-5' exonuclease PolX [Phycisphaeraceae bacterium]|nr:DNA polymerase/3'-5' exonuclease PolX [Phycisphaerales bacterium]MCB9842995.1 DNA polymerase/3'-5' exonuclease PolX [Phycisphaeraceae bacterium]